MTATLTEYDELVATMLGMRIPKCGLVKPPRDWGQSYRETIAEWVDRQVRLWAVPEPNTGCLLWFGRTIGPAGRDEYPAMHYRGRSTRITRALLGLPRGQRGSPRGSLNALHRCDTPLCVNRDHLFVGTPKDNMRDASKKGRCVGWNRYATHCSHGHEFTPRNTYVPPGRKKRVCKTCRTAVGAAWRSRHRV